MYVYFSFLRLDWDGAVQFQTKSCLFLGKILNDDQPLSEYKIDEKGFVVVMVTKVILSLIHI